jgi:hypothetical protein
MSKVSFLNKPCETIKIQGTIKECTADQFKWLNRQIKPYLYCRAIELRAKIGKKTALISKLNLY